MSLPTEEDLSSILYQIATTIDERVIFQSTHDPDAIALWIVGTYLMNHWTRFPKLLVVSPERECGKTTTLEAIEGLVFKGKMASSITAAALTRCIEKDSPTLLIDEADLTLQDNKQLSTRVTHAGVQSVFWLMKLQVTNGSQKKCRYGVRKQSQALATFLIR